MFLHYGLIHIGMNMLCLAQGRVIEQLFGRVSFFSIYLVSGLLGGVLSMARNSDVVSVGASGAVFGIYGAFGAYLVFRKAAMDEAIWQKTTRQIGLFVGINLVYGFATPGIDMSAHVGGFAAGFAVAAGLLAGKTADAQRTKRAIGLLVAGLAVTAATVVVIRPPVDVTPVLQEFDNVQAATVTKYEEIRKRAVAGSINDAQMADEIERDVIPGWKAMRANVFAVDKPPARLAPLFDALRDYVVSRQEQLDATVTFLRLPSDAQEAKLADVKAKEAATVHDFEQLQAVLGGLKR